MAVTQEIIDTITYSTTTPEISWRLVYETGATEGILFYSEGVTTSIANLEEFATEQDGIDRMAILGLTRIVDEVPE